MNNKIQSWILASRPKTLPAAFIPILTGTAAAYSIEKENFLAAMVALICSLLIQIGTNFVNDLYDFLAGKDTDSRQGPKRALLEGWLTKKEMQIGITIVFALAFLLGLYLVSVGGYIILAIGIISIISGIAYTAGPFPLAYNGLGDVFVFIFFGIVATVGTFYVQTLELNNFILIASLPVGFLITNILVVNNYRDFEEDKMNNKKTLIVILGKKFGKFQYSFSIIISYAIIISLSIIEKSFYLLLPLLTLPLAFLQIKMFSSLSGNKLNKLLASTAKFGILFSILFSIGIIL